MMKFGCPGCGQHYSGDAEWLGRSLQCSTCGLEFVISTLLILKPPADPPSDPPPIPPPVPAADPVPSAALADRTPQAPAVQVAHKSPPELPKKPKPAKPEAPQPAPKIEPTPPFEGLETYKPSGTVPLLFIPLALLLGVPAAGIAGMIAGIASQINPLPYFNIFLATGSGILIGAAVGSAAYLSRLRNLDLFGGIAFLLILGSQMVAFVYANMVNENEMADPWTSMQNRIAKGYEITHIAQSMNSNAQFLHISGIGMWICVVIAIVVMLQGVGTGAGFVTQGVFCEPCHRWTKLEKSTVVRADPTVLRMALQDGIAVQPTGHLPDARSLKLTLRACPGCNVAYLTVYEEIPKEGSTPANPKNETVLLALNVPVSPPTLSSLFGASHA